MRRERQFGKKGMPKVPRDNEENNWGFGTDDQVNQLAGAMYGSVVISIREEAAAYDIGAYRLRRTFEAARTEADRSTAILMFALAEDLMLSGLKQNLHGDVKGGWKELSSGNGLLATASDRITLLALLDWIQPTVYADLRVLKTIRNHFAHHPDVIGFDDKRVQGLVSALSSVEKPGLETMGKGGATAKSPRKLFLLRAASTLVRLVSNLAIGPAARQGNVAPGHVEELSWEQLPSNLQELHRIMAEHMIAVVSSAS